jgi:hypothetical protein
MRSFGIGGAGPTEAKTAAATSALFRGGANVVRVFAVPALGPAEDRRVAVCVGVQHGGVCHLPAVFHGE